MFKDFRPNLRPFVVAPIDAENEIEQLLRKGDLIKAGKLCRRCGLALDKFQSSIKESALKMCYKKQAATVLSFVYESKFDVGIDVDVLLKRAYDCGDWHGFLKNIHRFKKKTGFEHEIETAINHLIEKKQVADAIAWRRKIQSL